MRTEAQEKCLAGPTTIFCEIRYLLIFLVPCLGAQGRVGLLEPLTPACPLGKEHVSYED